MSEQLPHNFQVSRDREDNPCLGTRNGQPHDVEATTHNLDYQTGYIPQVPNLPQPFRNGWAHKPDPFEEILATHGGACDHDASWLQGMGMVEGCHKNTMISPPANSL